mmetsp:Transcript_17026/g.44011  ORF Transcript_17026/g.44011 Transcript_17026/m.44011 type:complete len:694 (-) Transcript_17026:109-2190(-)
MVGGRLLALGCFVALLRDGGAFNVNEVGSFTTHVLTDVTSSVHLHAVNATPVAFGDFDSDQYTDVLAVPPTRDALLVLLWDHETRAFREGPTVRLGISSIVNVVATDLNRDGQLDALVMSEAPHAANSTLLPPPCTELTFVPGLTTKFGEPVRLPPAFGQPLVFNANAEPASDLFGERCADDHALRGRGERVFWLNDGEGTFERVSARLGSRPLAHTPSPAAVDVDGDCRADLVVPVRSDAGTRTGAGVRIALEVWPARGGGHAGHLQPGGGTTASLKPSATIELPPGVQQLAWADLNADGTIDAVGPQCDILLGCGATNGTDTPPLVAVTITRPPPSKVLCDRAHFSLNVANVSIGRLPDGLGSFAPSSSPLPQPPLVRVGDFDLDGLPDLLGALHEPRSGEAHTLLLRNVRRSGGAVAFEATSWRRMAPGTVVISDGGEGGGGGGAEGRGADDPPAAEHADLGAAISAPNAHGAAFLDIDETGNLDIMLLRGSASSPTMTIARNAFQSDAYFLKVLTLGGQCLRWCGTKSANPARPPYGVNQPAVSLMFASNSAAGSRRVYAGTQLAVSAHSALLTPYVLFGLGRTNDYVNDFWVGLPIGSDDGPMASPRRRRFDAGIIPNSQLIAIPYPPDKPSRWTIELYISKANMLPWVALALSAGLTIIGMVVVLLELRERREDIREKKAMAPSLPL